VLAADVLDVLGLAAVFPLDGLAAAPVPDGAAFAPLEDCVPAALVEVVESPPPQAARRLPSDNDVAPRAESCKKRRRDRVCTLRF
jgi:hypothetical protein